MRFLILVIFSKGVLGLDSAVAAPATSLPSATSVTDSAISMVEDIGFPQSGGSIRFVPKPSFPLPSVFSYAQVTALMDDGTLAVWADGHLGFVSQEGELLVRIPLKFKHGVSKIIPGESGEVILLDIPDVLDGVVNVVVVDKSGRERARSNLSIYPYEHVWSAVYDDGELVAEWPADVQRRSARLRPARVGIATSAKVTPSDLRVATIGNESSLTTNTFISSSSRQGHNAKAMAGRLAERNDRARAFHRKLDGKGLPFYGEMGSSRPASESGPGRRWLRFVSTLAVARNGSVICQMHIVNPLGMHRADFGDPDQDGERYRTILVWFGESGRLETYLVVPPQCDWMVSGRAACLIDNSSGRPRVQFWIPDQKRK